MFADDDVFSGLNISPLKPTLSLEIHDDFADLFLRGLSNVAMTSLTLLLSDSFSDTESVKTADSLFFKVFFSGLFPSKASESLSDVLELDSDMLACNQGWQ